MKILHAITGLQKAAGTTVFVEFMVAEQRKLGHEVVVVLPGQAIPFVPDILHIHALWSPWLFKMYRWAKQQGCKIVWSPHGMITPWALSQKKWKKRLALALYQYWGLKGADLLHVTADSEVEDVRRLGLKNKVAIVPLGVDCSGSRRYARDDGHTPIRHCEARSDEAIRNEPIHTALFISRVHPKKGLFDLVDAWGALKPQGWRLVIAGPSQEGHAEAVIRRARALGLDEEAVQYIGPVFGEEKDKLYASADIFVLPTYSENFGVVVLEALAQGCPVLTTKETPWQALEKEGCGWWIDVGVKPLTEALQKVLALPQTELIQMGQKGYDYAKANYDWTPLARKIVANYELLLV